MGKSKYDGAGKIRLDHDQKVLVALTMVCAMARRIELIHDITATESEIKEREALNKWWMDELTEPGRNKIEAWMRAHMEPGEPRTSQEAILIMVCCYCRMMQLRYTPENQRSKSDYETWRRLEYDWSDGGQANQFKVVKWVKELYKGYDQLTVLL